MSMPLENYELQGPGDDRRIDRLVDGELSDADRRQLLLRLETEPDGWRRCALAFLETQSWRAALRPLAAQDRVVTLPAAAAIDHDRRLKPWRPVAKLTALAAGMAVAFALGWSLHDAPVKNTSSVPIALVRTSPPEAPSESPRIVPDDSAAREPRPVRPGEPPALLEPVVKQWEQRGYRAESQKRSVLMALKDGRKLDVPVHEVRLQYVGGRTY